MAIRLRWASPSASLRVIMLDPPSRFLRPPVWTRLVNEITRGKFKSSLPQRADITWQPLGFELAGA
jgi:hypothetical protein